MSARLALAAIPSAAGVKARRGPAGHPRYCPAVDRRSAFLSYVRGDRTFARRLHGDLTAHGVTCFVDDVSMLPGDDLDATLGEAIARSDVFLLACSERSLGSPADWWWVDREMSHVLQREQDETRAGRVRSLRLVPLDLDGYLFDPTCTYPRRADLASRVAAPFRGWEDDPATYEAGLSRLLRALEA